MIRGSPPTERKARTGELTPPTRTFSASAKISRERRWLRRTEVRVAVMVDLGPLKFPQRFGRKNGNRFCGTLELVAKLGRSMLRPCTRLCASGGGRELWGR